MKTTKGKIYKVKFICGHEAEVVVLDHFGNANKRLELIREEDCPGCRIVDDLDLFYEKAKKETQEKKLPELKGTRIDVVWATVIRHTFISFKFTPYLLREERPYKKYIDKAKEYLIENTIDASTWVEYAYNLEGFVIDEAIKQKEMAEKGITREDLKTKEIDELSKDNLLIPKYSADATPMSITIQGNTIVVKGDKPYKDIIKAEGFYWNPDNKTWEREINWFNGNIEDRIIELCTKVFAAGFPIDIDKEYHTRIINSEYEPEYKRWIYLTKYNDETMYAFYFGRDDLYNCIRGISKHTKWDRKNKVVLVPLANSREVLDFANLKDFKITDNAQKTLNEILNPTYDHIEVKENTYKEKDIEDILKEKNIIIDDLRDED